MRILLSIRQTNEDKFKIIVMLKDEHEIELKLKEKVSDPRIRTFTASRKTKK